MGEGPYAGEVFKPVVKSVAVDVVYVMSSFDAPMSSRPHRPMKVAMLITGANRREVVAAL